MRRGDNFCSSLIALVKCISAVVQVDGSYAAVRFPSSKETGQQEHGAGPSKEDPSSLLQDCRLLRKDELNVSMNGTFLSHGNTCIYSMKNTLYTLV